MQDSLKNLGCHIVPKTAALSWWGTIKEWLLKKINSVILQAQSILDVQMLTSCATTEAIIYIIPNSIPVPMQSIPNSLKARRFNQMTRGFFGFRLNISSAFQPGTSLSKSQAISCLISPCTSDLCCLLGKVSSKFPFNLLKTIFYKTNYWSTQAQKMFQQHVTYTINFITWKFSSEQWPCSE